MEYWVTVRESGSDEQEREIMEQTTSRGKACLSFVIATFAEAAAPVEIAAGTFAKIEEMGARGTVEEANTSVGNDGQRNEAKQIRLPMISK